MVAGGGGGGRLGGQMSIEPSSSAGMRGVYPGTQLRWRHRATRFAAQPARRLFIVRIGLLPNSAVSYVTHDKQL